MSPTRKFSNWSAASGSSYPVPPSCTYAAGIGMPPELSGGLDIGVARLFSPPPPPASAICSFPQFGRSNSTPASNPARNCDVSVLCGPVLSVSYCVADVRWKFSTQPTSRNGTGGKSRSNSPCADGSNGTLAPLFRSIGTTYPRTASASGHICDTLALDCCSCLVHLGIEIDRDAGLARHAARPRFRRTEVRLAPENVRAEIHRVPAAVIVLLRHRGR